MDDTQKDMAEQSAHEALSGLAAKLEAATLAPGTVGAFAPCELLASIAPEVAFAIRMLDDGAALLPWAAKMSTIIKGLSGLGTQLCAGA